MRVIFFKKNNTKLIFLYKRMRNACHTILRRGYFSNNNVRQWFIINTFLWNNIIFEFLLDWSVSFMKKIMNAHIRQKCIMVYNNTIEI